VDELRQLLTGELPKRIASIEDRLWQRQMWRQIGRCDQCRGRLAVLVAQD
jgi:hypothetical protein